MTYFCLEFKCLFLCRLRTFYAILGAAAAAFFNTHAVERAADDVVADAGEVLYAATAHEDNAVLLEGVTFVGNVGDYFVSGSKAHFRDLADSGIRLFRRMFA